MIIPLSFFPRVQITVYPFTFLIIAFVLLPPFPYQADFRGLGLQYDELEHLAFESVVTLGRLLSVENMRNVVFCFFCKIVICIELNAMFLVVYSDSFSLMSST